MAEGRLHWTSLIECIPAASGSCTTAQSEHDLNQLKCQPHDAYSYTHATGSSKFNCDCEGQEVQGTEAARPPRDVTAAYSQAGGAYWRPHPSKRTCHTLQTGTDKQARFCASAHTCQLSAGRCVRFLPMLMMIWSARRVCISPRPYPHVFVGSVVRRWGQRAAISELNK